MARRPLARADFTAWLLGASLPLLGLSLFSVAGSGVQPAMAAAALHLSGVFGRRRLRLRPKALAWALASTGSMLLALAGPLASPKGWAYFVTAGGALGLYALAIGDILAGAGSRRSFLHGFVACATLAAAVGLLQVGYSLASGGAALTFAYNPTFSISSQPFRASAFAPEASVLFPHLALALLLVLSRPVAAEIGLSRRARIAVALTLGAGLLATRSSSLLWFTPLLAAHYGRMLARREIGWSEAAGFAVALAAGSLVFAWAYAARIGASDADISASIRLAKIQAAITIFAQHPLFGAGLGAGSAPQVIGPNLPAWFVGTTAGQLSHAGVDSMLARTAMEQGLVGVLLFVAPALWAAASLASRSGTVRATAVSLLVTGVSFWVAVGYRDVPLSVVISVWALELSALQPRVRRRRSPSAAGLAAHATMSAAAA